MGREIRRVPPGWEHPRYTKADAPRRDHVGHHRPCHDHDYDGAARKWMAGLAAWEAGTHEAHAECASYCRYFWDYSHPPSEETSRPAFTAEATCFQIYETVSEGTPVSPVFESLEAMVEWLTQPNTTGDSFHMQGMTREQAERFTRSGQAFSMVITPTTGLVPGFRAEP